MALGSTQGLGGLIAGARVASSGSIGIVPLK